jgi:hypothetical protein
MPDGSHPPAVRSLPELQGDLADVLAANSRNRQEIASFSGPNITRQI